MKKIYFIIFFCALGISLFAQTHPNKNRLVGEADLDSLLGKPPYKDSLLKFIDADIATKAPAIVADSLKRIDSSLNNKADSLLNIFTRFKSDSTNKSDSLLNIFGRFIADSSKSREDMGDSIAAHSYSPVNDSSILMYYGGAFHDLTLDSTRTLLGVPHVNVKNFGAIGDGVANDSVAFANALKTKKDVLVDYGTYIIGKQRFYRNGQRLIMQGGNDPDYTTKTILRPTIYTDTLFIIDKEVYIEGGHFGINISSSSNFKCFFKITTGADYSVFNYIKAYQFSPLTDTISVFDFTEPTNSIFIGHSLMYGFSYGIRVDAYCHNTSVVDCKIVRNWIHGVWFNSPGSTNTYTFTFDRCDIESSGVDAGADKTTIKISYPVYQLRFTNCYGESNFTAGSRWLDIDTTATIDVNGLYLWGNHTPTAMIDWDSSSTIVMTMRNIRLQQINGGWFSHAEYPNKYLDIEGHNILINDGAPSLSDRFLARGDLIPADTMEVPPGQLYYGSSGTLLRKYTPSAFTDKKIGNIDIDSSVIAFDADISSIPNNSIGKVGGELVAKDNSGNQVILTDKYPYYSGKATISVGDTSVLVYHGAIAIPSAQDINITPLNNFAGVPYYVDEHDVNDTTFTIIIDTVGHPITTDMVFGWQLTNSGNVTYNLFDDFSDGDYTSDPVWTVSTGSYSVASSNLVCGTAGIISTPSTKAYGTWEFTVYRGNSLNATDVAFVAASAGALPDGYTLRILASGTVVLRKADLSNLFTTTSSYTSALVLYTFKIVRNSHGVFSVYIKGGVYADFTLIVAGGSGTNPVTDNTYTTSSYFVPDFDAGDKITNVKGY